MAVLTDADIGEILCATNGCSGDPSKLHIHGFEESSLTPIGYDLRVGERYSSIRGSGVGSSAANGHITIEPNETIIVTTLERVTMPKDRSLSAVIVSKVSQVSRGLSYINGTIDPDYEGRLIASLHNDGTKPLTLTYGERFCTGYSGGTALRGMTPRGMVDCMIAAVAWRQSASLLAQDVDLVRVCQILGITLDLVSAQT